MIFDCWVKLNLPDFGEYSWEELHVLRDSDAGRDFRAMVDRLLANIEGDLSNITDPRDINELITRTFSKELIKEMNTWRPTTSWTVLSLVLNWLPLPFCAGAVVSSFKGLGALQKEQTSWVSLTRPQG